jgi:hypothetical protein
MATMNKIWDKALRISLSTSRLILIAPDGGDIHFGFRKNLQLDQINKSSMKKIYCFGGSTTFGHGVGNENTWPSLLANQIGFEIVNCGIVKNDLKASLNTLVALLRLGHKPDAIIFLDGINEFSGFTFWLANQNSYIDFDTNYINLNHFYEMGRITKTRFSGILNFFFGAPGRNFQVNFQKKLENEVQSQKKNVILKFIRIMRASYQVFADRHKIINHELTKTESNAMVEQAAQSYLNSKKTIKRIANAFDISNIFFFLQPSLFDCRNNSKPNAKHIYLKELYRKIKEEDTEIIDISEELSVNKVAISPEMFYDWQHLNEEGNKILAQVIEKNIRLHSNLL